MGKVRTVLVKILKVILGLRFRHLHVFRGSGRRGVLRVLVHVGHHNRLRKRGAHVKTRTLLPVTTRADLEVERTVDAILDDVGKKKNVSECTGKQSWDLGNTQTRTFSVP